MPTSGRGPLLVLGITGQYPMAGVAWQAINYLLGFQERELQQLLNRLSHEGGLTDPDDVAIVRAIISLGRALNLTVVAEGVENEPALDLLREFGCDQYQGYLSSEPLPAAGFAARYLNQAG